MINGFNVPIGWELEPMGRMAGDTHWAIVGVKELGKPTVFTLTGKLPGTLHPGEGPWDFP